MSPALPKKYQIGTRFTRALSSFGQPLLPKRLDRIGLVPIAVPLLNPKGKGRSELNLFKFRYDKLSEARKGGVKTALLVVDMQNDFIRFKNSPVYVPPAKKIIPKIAKLLTACRKNKIPIVCAITSHKKDRSDWALLDKKYHRAYCIENTPGAKIIPEINPQKIEYIVRKRRYSAFYKTNLEKLLKRLKIKKLIVCGVTTSCCVSSTVRDAYFRDYEVMVASDAVSATHRDLHRASLKYFRENIGLVLRTDGIIKHLESNQQDRVYG